MIYIKIFGVERSGALFTGRFIRENLRNHQLTVFNNEFGNVNGPPVNKTEVRLWLKNHLRPKQQIIRIHKGIQNGSIKIVPIVVIKNPYTWYKSIHRHRKKRIKEMDWDREYGIYNLLYKIHRDLLDDVNDKYDNIYSQGLFLNYELIISDPTASINKLTKLLQIEPIKEGFLPKSPIFNDKVKDFYLSNGPWKLSPSDIRRVNERVDWELMNYYGYKKIEPEDFYDLVVYEEDEWTFAV